MKKKIMHFSFFFLVGLGFELSFVLTKQVLYCLSQFFALVIFGDGGLAIYLASLEP
jgi:hypothetical protein